MNPKALFRLRKKAVLKFQSPKKLRNLVNRIIMPSSQIPLVVGYEDFNEKQWRTSYLKPKTPSEEITLNNFLEGLKKVEIEWEKSKKHKIMSDFNKFEGIFVFEGVDTKHYSNQDTRIMSIMLRKDLVSYFLGIYWSGKDLYGTESIKENSSIMEKIMDSHLGPSNKYERTLI